jgi:DNA polymerase III subunit epsilon
MTHEEMAAALTATGLYRVLRKLERRLTIPSPNDRDVRLALFVDVETTGLDPVVDEIVDLAMVPFTYDTASGVIYEIREPFQSFRQPTNPIPAAITAITGITDEMVAGHTIDPMEVVGFIDRSALVIAHNAAFDRRFLERLCGPIKRPWVCSMTQIDWVAEGYDGTRLAYLATSAGFFYDKHQAAADCFAGIEMLATTLPRAGTPALVALLENGRRPTWRIWAIGSPFDVKDTLKARGYNWHAGKKSWHIAVDETERDAEIDWLCKWVYRRAFVPPMDRITAYDRFSDREIPA